MFLCIKYVHIIFHINVTMQTRLTRNNNLQMAHHFHEYKKLDISFYDLTVAPILQKEWSIIAIYFEVSAIVKCKIKINIFQTA